MQTFEIRGSAGTPGREAHGDSRHAVRLTPVATNYGAGGVPVTTHFTRSWKFAIATSVPKSQWP